MNIYRKAELLTVLADGCKRHPAYRAIRPATGNCAPCAKMWSAKLEMTGHVSKMEKSKSLSNLKGTSINVSSNKGVSSRPINEHGDYDGTDVGFTSNSIQDAETETAFEKNKKKSTRPINKHGNYDGTDAGFTSGSFSQKK